MYGPDRTEYWSVSCTNSLVATITAAGSISCAFRSKRKWHKFGSAWIAKGVVLPVIRINKMASVAVNETSNELSTRNININ